MTDTRTIQELRTSLRSIRDELPHVCLFRAIAIDVNDAIRAIGRLDRSWPDAPPMVASGPRDVLIELRGIRDRVEVLALQERDRRRGLDLRSANLSIARAVIFAVQEIAELEAAAEQLKLGVAA